MIHPKNKFERKQIEKKREARRVWQVKTTREKEDGLEWRTDHPDFNILEQREGPDSGIPLLDRSSE